MVRYKADGRHRWRLACQDGPFGRFVSFGVALVDDCLVSRRSRHKRQGSCLSHARRRAWHVIVCRLLVELQRLRESIRNFRAHVATMAKVPKVKKKGGRS